MLDCLPLLTLGKMLQEKMVHQSDALWALGSKAEKLAEETVPADISTAAWWESFHCPTKKKKKSFVNKVDRQLKVEVPEQNCEMRGLFFLCSPFGFLSDRIRAAMET